MDNLKLDALYSELSSIWTKMAGITVRGLLFNANLNRRSKFDPTSTAVQG